MEQELKEKILKEWVVALNSKRFEQAEGALRINDGCCCLGVLCEVAIDNNYPLKAIINAYGRYTYNGMDDYLPADLALELGFTTARGDFKMTEDIQNIIRPYYRYNDNGNLSSGLSEFCVGKAASLAGLNDYDIPFECIAKIVTAKPPELFKE